MNIKKAQSIVSNYENGEVFGNKAKVVKVQKITSDSYGAYLKNVDQVEKEGWIIIDCIGKWEVSEDIVMDVEEYEEYKGL